VLRIDSLPQRVSVVRTGQIGRMCSASGAYSGQVDHRFRSKPITNSGMAIRSERSDAGYDLLG